METFCGFVKWLNDNQGATSAVLTLVYVGATIVLVTLTNKQLRQSVALEMQRTRPHVVFELLANNGVVMASIRNLGHTSARNLRVKIDPELKCLLGGQGCNPPDEREESMPLASHPIASLAPGREVTGFVAFWGRFHERYPGMCFRCVVSYEGPDGTRYSESSELDLSGYLNLKTVKVKGLGDISGELAKISDSLSRLGRGVDVPLVRSISDAEYARQQADILAKAVQELERLKNKEKESRD